jgi:hypothetical protein
MEIATQFTCLLNTVKRVVAIRVITPEYACIRDAKVRPMQQRARYFGQDHLPVGSNFGGSHLVWDSGGRKDAEH